MLGYQKLKKQLIPLFKGIPFILVIFVLSLFAAKKMIDYTPNTYQSIAKIKLDDQKYGFSNNNLFGDFDVFSTENKIEAEAEILQSPLIVGKALDSLNFSTVLYRVGSFKNTMLYNDSPIKVEHKSGEPKFYNKTYKFSINGNQVSVWDVETEEVLGEGFLGFEITIPNGSLVVSTISNIVSKGIKVDGDYAVKIFDEEGLVADVINRLNVSAIDKEISVLRVVYTDEHPQKVADLVNALCKAYINDYVETKSSAAIQTESFINEKLTEVGAELTMAENEIETFKIDNDVVNTLQETETGLREISKLNVSLINLEMNEKSILKLKEYLDSGEFFDETAIAFGFGDLLMTELVKKLKYWEDEKRDLLLLYQPESQKVVNIDQKIKEIKDYVIVAINQNLNEIKTKRSEIEAVLLEESKMFDNLPMREKNQNILDRNFNILENVYNFLSQKKIEASIAGSAQHSFHRVIEKGTVPNEPISPNRTLIKFVFGLLGLIVSISVVYLRSLLRAKVKTKEDIEGNTTLPLLGVVRKKKTEEDILNVSLALDLKNGLPKKGIVAIASTLNGEGKSHFAHHFAIVLKSFGVKSEIFKPNSENHIQSMEELKRLQEKTDVVVVDCPSTASGISGVHFMKKAEMSIYLLRSEFTPNSMISHPELLANEYGLKNVHLVLNGAHRAMNYSGNLIGSRFTKSQRNGPFARVKDYIQTYVFG